MSEAPTSQVLIIDDNEDLIENISDLLEELGVQTHALTNADAALEIAARGFDLALVDIGLPNISGVELLSRLKANNQFAEVVLMTGHGTLESAIEAVHHGAFAYLLKPFDPDAMVRLAERALAQVSLRRERVALAMALSESEALYRGVVDNVDSFIVGIGLDGRIVFCNHYALTTYGGTEGQIYGRPFVEVCAPRDESLQRAISAVMASRSPREHEAEMLTAQGERRVVRWRLRAVQPGSSERIGYIAVGTDITEQQELRRRSADAEALASIGVLTAGLAHEIRNPLNAASLQLQLLSRRVGKLEDERAAEKMSTRIDIVRSELGRLSQLLDDFLGLARPQNIRQESFDVGDLIQEVVTLEKPLCAADSIELLYEVGSKLIARGDRGRIQQVLVNLVQNAREAMLEHEGGTIRIAAQADSDWVTISVQDSGPGIPDEVNLFEPFYTTKAAGTGLGLAIVHRIITIHGGEISIKSSAGEGALCTFTIPKAL